MDDIGFPLQPESVAANADRILVRNHNDVDTDPEPMGESWPIHFLKRYPHFDVEIQETLDIGRFQAMRPQTFRLLL
jgi:hypothetical protein